MMLKLQATPEEVMRAVEALREFTCRCGLGEKDIFALCLGLEECGSNIVNHALQRNAAHTFQVLFQHAPPSFVIELRDRGPAFDPTLAAERKTEAADEDTPGGWGIQLVRRYMDEIRYAREAGENVLRLTRRVTGTNAEKI